MGLNYSADSINENEGGDSNSSSKNRSSVNQDSAFNFHHHLGTFQSQIDGNNTLSGLFIGLPAEDLPPPDAFSWFFPDKITTNDILDANIAHEFYFLSGFINGHGISWADHWKWGCQVVFFQIKMSKSETDFSLQYRTKYSRTSYRDAAYWNGATDLVRPSNADFWPGCLVLSSDGKILKWIHTPIVYEETIESTSNDAGLNSFQLPGKVISEKPLPCAMQHIYTNNLGNKKKQMIACLFLKY